MHDVRFGLRMLRKSPVFTGVAIFTLALGIGGVTTLFSIVEGTLLAPLPFRQGEDLVVLWTENPSEGQDRYFVSPMDFGDWREFNTTFRGMAGLWPTPVAITELDGGPTRASAVYVTEEFFEVLGGSAFRGRTFTPDDGPGSQQLAVVSQAIWETRFGSDPDIIGRSLVIDGAPVEVVGVVRSEHTYPEGTDLWLNITFPMTVQSRYARWMSAIGRLEDGVTLQRAQEDMDRIALRLAEEHPADVGWGVGMDSLQRDLIGDTSRALWILLGATGLILLIASANVANLLLSRAEGRSLEVAVRSAFGASRGRIGKQLVLESLLLAGFGAAVGIAGAWTSLKLLPSLAPDVLPFTATVSLNGIVLAVTLGVTCLTGVLFGLAPVVKLLRGTLFSPLREGTRGTRGAARARAQTAFVVAQLALATILTTGAGLLARSFGNLQTAPMGFESEGILTFETDLSPTAAEDDENVSATYELLLQALEGIPGVEAAAATSELPLTEALDYSQPFVVEDRLSVDAEETRAFFRHVTPEFFPVMQTAVEEGRGLDSFDRLAGAPVVVVNRTLADRYWPGESPLGKRISNTQYRWGPLGAVLVSEAEVVGVVEDIRYEGARHDPQPALYFNYQQAPIRRMTFTVKTSGDPEALVADVRSGLSSSFPDLPIANLATMEQVVGRAFARDRFSTLLLSIFGFAALVLATVGVYGVLAYSVEQRVREVGIRMALGATAHRVRNLVLKEGMILVGIGLALGLLGALVLGDLLSSQLFGVTARDPLVLGVVLACLAAAGILAAGVPAQRATTVDPLEAMRGE